MEGPGSVVGLRSIGSVGAMDGGARRAAGLCDGAAPPRLCRIPRGAGVLIANPQAQSPTKITIT